jgi:UDP-N-acetylglucosamine:LPS N-acetylglucosamine transferase
VTLVVVGTEHFDALVAELDRLVAVGRLPPDAFGQIGSGQYVPRHFPWVRYEPDLWQRFAAADLIVTHGGTGLVTECIVSGRPFIAVPDPLKPENHQLEFLEALTERFDFCWVREPAQLEAALPHARPARRKDGLDVQQLANDILAFVTHAAGG